MTRKLLKESRPTLGKQLVLLCAAFLWCHGVARQTTSMVWALATLRNPTSSRYNLVTCTATKTSLQRKENEWKKWLLSDNKDVNIDDVELEPITSKTGFCNTLYLVKMPWVSKAADKSAPSRVSGLLKVYSDLAKARMQLSSFRQGMPDNVAVDATESSIGPHTTENIDYQVGRLGLGPHVYRVSPELLYMEFYENGRPLREDDLKDTSSPRQTTALLRSIGEALAHLHSIPEEFSVTSSDHPGKPLRSSAGHTDPVQRNMLWESLDIILDRIPDETTRSFYRTEVERQKSVLESLALPTVLGHGDFKPSNILLLVGDKGEESQIRFIDFETVGSHYRAFDLAKLFRTKSPSGATEEHKSIFLRSYQKAWLEHATHGSASSTLPLNDECCIPRMLLESKLLLPMTWLEAAIFFQASRRPDQWAEWSLVRTHEYKKSLMEWEKDVQTYKQCYI